MGKTKELWLEDYEYEAARERIILDEWQHEEYKKLISHGKIKLPRFIRVIKKRKSLPF